MTGMIRLLVDEAALSRARFRDRADASAASLHFMLAAGAVVLFWGFFALSPSETEFFARDFMRFNLPKISNSFSHRVTAEDVEFATFNFAIGYAVCATWVFCFLVSSTANLSVLKGYVNAWCYTFAGSVVVGASTAILFGLAEMAGAFQKTVDRTGSVGNALFTWLAIVLVIAAVAVFAAAGGAPVIEAATRSASKYR